MKRSGTILIAWLFLFLACSTTQGAEGSIYRTVWLRQDFDTVGQWMQAHQSEISDACKYRVLKRDGSNLLVERQTAKGLFRFTVREVLIIVDGRADYEATVMPDDNIRRGRTRVVVSRYAKGTNIETWMDASVTAPGISSLDVRVGLNASYRGFERLLLDDLGRLKD